MRFTTEMKHDDLDRTDPQSLTQMMSLDADGEGLWGPDELGAILEHQLAAPLECDLVGLDGGLAQWLAELNSCGDRPLRTFADLLYHPSPPPKLLELTKQFAKSRRNHPHSPLPDEVATVLYFLSIVAAMTRCGRRITRMDDSSLIYGLRWALRQPWLGDSARAILQEGLQAAGGTGPETE
jgi:hypothetical protein